MRSRVLTALGAVVVSIVSLQQPLPAGGAQPRAAGGVALSFTDLGKGFYPYKVNNSAVAAGMYIADYARSARAHRPHDAGPQAVWKSGKITVLPLGDGYGGGVATLTDAGVAEGAIYGESATRVVVWHPPYTTASTINASFTTAILGDEATGNLEVATGQQSGWEIVGPAGNVVHVMAANESAYRVGPTSFAGSSNGFYLQQYSSGARTPIDFYPTSFAGDGAVVGYTDASPSVGKLLLPDGTEKTLPVSQPVGVDKRHDVVTSTQILFAGTTKPVNVSTYLPKTLGNAQIYAISNNGIITGGARDSASVPHGFMLRPQTGQISGQLLRGSAPNKAFRPAHAVPGVTVTAVGRTTGGVAVHDKATTDSSGRYTLDTPPGTYTVTFPPGVCASVAGAKCATSARTTVTTTKTLDAVALAALLRVTVTLHPKTVTLPFDKKTNAAAPKKITVTVTVKNVGVRTADNVRAPAQLTRSYDASNVVKVPQIPVKQTAGPEIGGKHTAAIGDLAPGRSRTVSYALRASGDGVYDIEALVVGSQPLLGRVAGTGKAILKIGAPVLVMSLKFGRSVKSPAGHGLLNGGSPFTIAATLENRSYTKRLFVSPPKVTAGGNAAGGVFVAAGAPLSTPQALSELHISQYFTINPRSSVKAEILFRTSRSVADIENALGSSLGGTAADIHVSEPVVHEVTDDDSVGARVAANEVFVVGKDDYHVGIDDSSTRVTAEEKTFLGYTLAISWGTMQGLWNLTIGGVIGLWDGLKTLVESGTLLKLPKSVINYMEAEAELWNSIREGPSKGQFLDVFDSFLTLAYVHATGVRNSVSGLVKSANAALVAHLNKIADDYENGDYRGAVAEMAKEGTETVGTLVLGTGVLTRWKPAVEALEAGKAALFEKFGALLEAGETKLYVSASEALATLKNAAPGYRFNLKDMASYYGMSESQVEWLLNFCKEQKIVVTLRSRAAESLAWLDKGAVLKPEQIKIKTVNVLDAKWLGFGNSNIGRVVIRSEAAMPSESELVATLKRAGLSPADEEYQSAITRLNDRIKELHKGADVEGYAAFLENASKEGKLTLRWNLEDNAVNPQYAPNGYTTYDFRLAADGAGNRVAEFKVNGTWRSVTGDIDLLSVVAANGDPLSEVRRFAIYKAIAKSPLGLMHPAADTWTKLEKVGGKLVNAEFNFEAKINEFTRSGTSAQFAPDNSVRAVVYNKNSVFTNAKSYRIFWDGGYNQIVPK